MGAITACTVMSVGRLARSAPETPARTVVHLDGIHVLAGFIPPARQPMPGTHELREGYPILSLFVEHHRAMRDYANVESTVYH